MDRSLVRNSAPVLVLIAALGLTGLACGGSTTAPPGGDGTGGSAEPTDAAGGGGAHSDGQVTPDAGLDRAPPVVDATSEADAPLCAPAPIGTWKPTWKPPKTPQPTACSTTQIDGYLDVCRRSYSATACNAFETAPANATCLGCMLTPENEAAYGAVVMRKKDWSVNSPGCLALKDGDASATSCGAKVQALQQCQVESCYVPCASGTYEDYAACQNQAKTTTCLLFDAKTICEDGPKYFACFASAGSAFADWMRLYAILFCSQLPEGGPGDAAADGPRDGAGDALSQD
jgi:hypothetical protein